MDILIIACIDSLLISNNRHIHQYKDGKCVLAQETHQLHQITEYHRNISIHRIEA